MASNTVIRTNMLALNSHRNLGLVGLQQARSSQRLSSGFRINSAADDAAGLAISEKMRAQIRGLNQADRNTQDGISLIQTAEGAMSEINEMVNRIRELVVQASNDTNVHEEGRLELSDRVQIQREIDQLLEEIDDVTTRTEFNTRVLLDGRWGSGEGGAVFAHINNAMINNILGEGRLPASEDWAAFSDEQLTAIRSFVNNNVGTNLTAANIDAAILDNVLAIPDFAAIVGNPNRAMTNVERESLANALVAETGLTLTQATQLVASIEATNNTTTGLRDHLGTGSTAIASGAALNALLVGEAFADPQTTMTNIEVAEGLRDWLDTLGGGGAFGEIQDMSIENLHTAIQNAAGQGNGGPALSGDAVANIAAAVRALSVAQLDAVINHAVVTDPGEMGTFLALLNAGSPQVSEANLTQLTGDGRAQDVLASVNAVLQGDVGENLQSRLRVVANVNAQEFIHANGSFTNTAEFADWFNTNFGEEGIFTNQISENAAGTALWFQVGANEGQGVRLNIEAVNTWTMGIRALHSSAAFREDATTRGTGGLAVHWDGDTDAAMADLSVEHESGQVIGSDLAGFNFGRIGMLDRALAHVTGQRAILGAVQNRLEHTSNSLQISSENLSSANSRIRDTDMGLEMMRLTQSNILQQAAISMLAQGNMAPQSVLQLLG